MDDPQRLRLKAALDAHLRTQLEPVAMGLGAFFAMLAISRSLLEEGVQAELVMLNAVTALVLAFVGVQLNKKSFAGIGAHPIGVGIVALAALNYLLSGTASTVFGFVPFFLLIIWGTGMMFLSRGWALLVLSAVTTAFLLHPAREPMAALIISLVSSLIFLEFHIRIVSRNELHRMLQQSRLDKSLEVMSVGVQSLAEQAQDLIFRYRLRPVPGHAYINPASERILGYSPAEFYADPGLALRVVHPDDRALAARIPENGETFITRNIRKDGAVVWLEQQVIQISDSEGNVVAIDGISRDVTDRIVAEQVRQRAESAMQENDDRLRRALEAAKIGIWNWDLLTNKVSWTEVAPLLGLAPAMEFDESLTAFLQSLHPGDLAHMAKLARKALEGKASYDVEFRVFWPDGSMHWLTSKGTVQFDENQRPLRMMGHIQDITERKHADAKIHESEERLRLSLEAAEIGIWDWNLRTNAIQRTGGLLAHYGRPEGGLNEFDSFQNAIDEEDRPRIQAAIQAAVKRGAPYDVEFRTTWPDGSKHWIVSVGSVYRDETGEPYRMMGYMADITKRKLAEQELTNAKQRAEEANRLKTSILANMSHEIRTPMTAILGYSDLLSRQLKGTTLEKHALTIHRGGSRLLHLLNSIVDLARIESGKASLTFVPHDLGESIERVVSLLRVLAEQKGIFLTVDRFPPVTVITDQHAEEQIFTNVIGNAIRFTESGGVTLRVRQTGNGMAMVEVIDTGIGISPDFLPLIAEEFRQESEGIGRTHEGSGLGLSITKKLIERMNGTLQFSSRKGAGTMVTIGLPLAPGNDASSRPAATGGGSGNERSATGLSILVVEDDRATGEMMQDLLSGEHQVVWRQTSVDALSAAASHRFDLVLVDINLRGSPQDGVALQKQLRLIPAYQSTPICAVTAYVMTGDRERFLKEGFDGFLGKPFLRSELENLLRGVGL